MKVFFYIFICMCWYGLLSGALAAALISFVFALFILYCDKYMATDEAHPDNAKQPPDSVVLLDKAGVECSTPDFHP